MRNLDFAPLYRATVGFDRIADLMDRVLSVTWPSRTYPPYNIEKTAEDAYRISIAVAGFARRRADGRSEGRQPAHHRPQDDRGRRAHLSAPRHRHPRVRASLCPCRPRPCDGCRARAGMLHIDLVREMPEALKPRRIEIARANGATPVLEAKAETVN